MTLTFLTINGSPPNSTNFLMESPCSMSFQSISNSHDSPETSLPLEDVKIINPEIRFVLSGYSAWVWEISL
jgi:hypothetical protein